MTSKEARVGMRVKIRGNYHSSDRRGREGTIAETWGDPAHFALDVEFGDGTRQLFWYHEVERIAGSIVR